MRSPGASSPSEGLRVTRLAVVETINLGAVLFALLLLVWLLHAVPRIAERRDLMGRARATDHSHDPRTARDLTDAAHRRQAPEVHAAMPENRLLTRPVDPTRRPRFEEPARVELETVEPEAAQRRTRAAVLIALAAASAIAVVLAVAGVISWLIAALPMMALVADVVLLRRAELARRDQLRHEVSARRRTLAAERVQSDESATAHTESVGSYRAETSGAEMSEAEQSALPEASAPVTARPGEWIPRPVPRPTYSLRGDVDDLQSRHAAHRASILQGAMPLEREDVEEREAAEERVATLPVAVDLGLDEILARRRGA